MHSVLRCRPCPAVRAAAVIVAAVHLLVVPPRLSAITSDPQAPAAANAAGTPAALPSSSADYVIGANDVLFIVFWRDKELSGEVTVRPDGRISLPLLNDVQAAGLTPTQLQASLFELASKYMQEPSVAVVVKQVNSRQVFITGEVEKPGAYPLTAPMTIMQLIAMAGGLKEYADRKHIVLMRVEDGHQYLLPFNYDALSKRRQVSDNRELKPGDTVVVR